jgi:hypothetical protein
MEHLRILVLLAALTTPTSSSFIQRLTVEDPIENIDYALTNVTLGHIGTNAEFSVHGHL